MKLSLGRLLWGFPPRNGIEKKYYWDMRLKSESTWENRKLEGIAKTYYRNGNVEAVCYFKNDKLEGTCTAYYENGDIRGEENYKNGQCLSEICYDKKGRKI
jgi:antitoxin component YwqK of YwqJK toxin-antitoxin module